jgi:uncharacterized membrane protein YhaH (DUF805 family)
MLEVCEIVNPDTEWSFFQILDNDGKGTDDCYEFTAKDNSIAQFNIHQGQDDELRFYLKGDIDNGDISDLLKIPKNNIEFEKITEFLDNINGVQNTLNLKKMEYYYSTNGNDKNGPFSFDELKQKKITTKTLIWHEELDELKMAGQLPELKNLIEKASITLKKKESVREKINLDKKPETNNLDTLVVNEKQKMFSKPFSYKGRIRRLEYGITLIIFYLGIVFIGGMAEAEETLGILALPLYWVYIVQGAKRCHDLGNSGWYQLIPFYFFWMIFAKGDDGINEYGPNPKM